MTVISTAYVNPRSPATVAFADANGSSTNPNNSYSFGVSYGPLGLHATRKLIAIVRSRNANLSVSGNPVDSLTIGGVGCTNRFQTVTNSDAFTIWTCDMPAGASGTLTVTRSTGNGFEFAHFVLFAGYDLRSAAPQSVLGDVLNAAPQTRNNVIPFGGMVAAVAYASGVAANFTWTGTGVVEVADLVVGAGALETLSGALITKQQPAGTRPGTFPSTSTFNGGNGNHNQLAAVFR